METLGVRSMCREWQLTEEGQASKLYADAPAALIIAKRQGAGKMRRINVKNFWLQEIEVQAELPDEKVRGEDNLTDGLTKHVRQELAEKYAAVVGVRLSADRAEGSLQLAGGGRQEP